MEVVRKAISRAWIPHLRIGTRGPETKAALLEVVETVLHTLKTGYQWRQLPLKQFLPRMP